tara:strand:+ start:26357 stop:26641 length:285 start_codon:yes stop_codon:yes gene_type:complete
MTAPIFVARFALAHTSTLALVSRSPSPSPSLDASATILALDALGRPRPTPARTAHRLDARARAFTRPSRALALDATTPRGRATRIIVVIMSLQT